ncbi:MAG TPA: DUF4199 domain-containing protein [Balneolaceae bacterium]
MQESQQTLENEQPSYWTSVGVAGLIFGIITFALSLISIYAAINAEPTGSPFSATSLLGIVVCLVAAFGGMLATWHYANEYNAPLTLGRGALIGLLTGVCITIVTIILSQIWQFIDPDMVQQWIDATVANFEAMDLPEEQKQQIIDSTVESMRDQYNIFRQLWVGILMYGILNLLTGMIGAKIFGKKEADNTI